MVSWKSRSHRGFAQPRTRDRSRPGGVEGRHGERQPQPFERTRCVEGEGTVSPTGSIVEPYGDASDGGVEGTRRVDGESPASSTARSAERSRRNQASTVRPRRSDDARHRRATVGVDQPGRLCPRDETNPVIHEVDAATSDVGALGVDQVESKVIAQPWGELWALNHLTVILQMTS